MKILLILAMIGGALSLHAAEASAAKKEAQSLPDYSREIKAAAESPLLAEWQVKHAKEIASATADHVLDGFLANGRAADELLARVKKAYTSDPLDMIQIAATTQRALVSSARARKVWISALKRAMNRAPDDYRRAFYHDQLVLCGEK